MRSKTSDVDETTKLIREDDEVVYGDSGYTGITKREEVCNNEHLSNMEFRINIRPSSLKTSKTYTGINWDK
ncbi:MAG: IS5/IS1182 family transposase, partial [Clostridiales bacterium]|nr:IS5/IS1182 family transposase [Clostridiales bacterium]